MNLEKAVYRINDVAKPDSITASNSDFLATHVEMKQIQLLDQFNIQPARSKYYSENEVFQNLVLNPDNKHQLIIVYGESGTGKSHLIRWFNAMFEKNKPDNEVILFIKRSDNTLKGTIKQLLEKPEVQNISNRDIYERLVKASVEMPEKQLKSTIYHSFITIIENIDDDNYNYKMNSVEKRRFTEYFRSSKTEELLSKEGGPIERIYSKIAEHTFVDRDVIAEFKKEDFLDEDFNNEMQNSEEMTKAAKRTIMKLNSDEGDGFADQIAKYLNQFIPEVVQRCSGIQPGDFAEIFKDIRSELYKIGKNLTLFIEDITSFTGVDTALLNALIEEHTGAYNKICRLSSIVGSTSNYVNQYFLQNHKDRVTKYIYIPRDAFDPTSLFEFFGKYLNTMSLDKTVVDAWADNGARAADYPVHEKKEADYWDMVKISSGQFLSLYPFTKSAILNFYNYKLGPSEKIPRYILRMIIEPVISELINEKSVFPSKQFNFMNHDSQLSFEVGNQVSDNDLSERMIRFMSIWGTGKAINSNEKGHNLISGIDERIYSDFGFPILKFGSTVVVEPEPEPIVNPGINQNQSNNPQINRIKLVKEALDRWARGEEIDISTTVGASGTLREARDMLSELLGTAINWEAEGVPYDMISRISSSTTKIATFDGIKRNNKGFYYIKQGNDTRLLWEALCRKVIYKNDWDYEGVYFDAYVITSWIERNKKGIVQSVKYYKEKETYNYVEPAICLELIRQALNGEYHDRTFKNLDEVMYKPVAVKDTSNKHLRKWNGLLEYFYQQSRGEEVKDCIRQYFNIRQGTIKANVFIVDTKRLDNSIKKMRSSRFLIDPENMQNEDDVNGRKRMYQSYSEVFNRLSDIVTEEKENAINKLKTIEECFDGLIDADLLTDFCEDVTTYTQLINNIQINTQFINVNEVKQAPAKIVSGINTIKELVQSEDILDQLMLLSNDPVKAVEPLLTLINSLKDSLSKVEGKLIEKEKALAAVNNEEDNNYYANIKSDLSSSEDCLGRLS